MNKTKTGFGLRLTVLRERLGLTQKQLGQKVWNIGSQGLISQYENGNRLPQYHNLVALCWALGASADVLLGLKPMPEEGE